MQAPTRNKNGKFAIGNPGGPGRPPIERERQYVDTLKSACSVEDWQAICERAIKDAKDGDHRARDWLSKYLLGEPQAQILHGHLHANVDREEHESFEGASPDAIIGVMAAMDRLRHEAREAKAIQCVGGA